MRTSSGLGNGFAAKPELIHCKSAAQLRAFFSLPKRLGEKNRAIKRREATSPRFNPAVAGPHAFLLVYRRGRPVIRAFTGKGWFSLFDGEDDAEAARLLTDEMKRLQEAWGSETLVGPIAPDALGYGAGLLVSGFENEGAPMTPENRPWCEKLLVQNGFCVAAEERLYRIVPESLLALTALCDKSNARFGVTARRLYRKRADYEAVFAFSGVGRSPAAREDVWRAFDRLKTRVAGRYSFVAYTGGKPSGILLCLKDGARGIRVSTIAVAREGFSGAVTLSLLGALAAEILKRRPARVTAGVISTTNCASQGIAAHFHAASIRAYHQYRWELHKN